MAAKNSVIVRPLKVNWAVCINLINNVSKVITNNQSINSLSKVWTLITFVRLRTLLSGQRYRIYTVQKPTQRKWLCKKKKKQMKKIGFLSEKARQNCLTSKNLCPILIICRQFGVFIPATAICTRALWYFFYEVTSMQVNTLQGN